MGDTKRKSRQVKIREKNQIWEKLGKIIQILIQVFDLLIKLRYPRYAIFFACSNRVSISFALSQIHSLTVITSYHHQQCNTIIYMLVVGHHRSNLCFQNRDVLSILVYSSLMLVYHSTTLPQLCSLLVTLSFFHNGIVLDMLVVMP